MKRAGSFSRSGSTSFLERGGEPQVENAAGGEDHDETHSDECSSFAPSVKLKRVDDGSVLITTVVLKESSLSSSLFRILEEERADIVYENQYRTETKVSHTILVNLLPGFDTGALRRRLYAWAGKKS